MISFIWTYTLLKRVYNHFQCYTWNVEIKYINVGDGQLIVSTQRRQFYCQQRVRSCLVKASERKNRFELDLFSCYRLNYNVGQHYYNVNFNLAVITECYSLIWHSNWVYLVFYARVCKCNYFHFRIGTNIASLCCTTVIDKLWILIDNF